MSGITVVRSSDLDAVLEQGRTSDRFAVIEGSITLKGSANEDRTIASGYDHVHANLDIGNGRTWVISSGAWLFSIETLSITGTGVLTITGNSRVV